MVSNMVSDPLTDRLLGYAPNVCGERPMRIVCPNCEISYHLDASTLGPTGRSVRCVRCRMIWFAGNTEAFAEIAASHRADMAQFAAATPDGAPPEGWPEDRPEDLAAPRAASDPADIAFVNDAPPAGAVPSATASSSESDAVLPTGGPVPVVESPALAPTESAVPTGEISQAEDIESVAARRALAQSRKRRGAALTRLRNAILALVAINLGLVGWRAEIVRRLPQTASFFAAIRLPVNLRGLVITDVATEMQTNEGVAVLLVEGRIVSTAKRTVEVPRLSFAARNEQGAEIYTWSALPGRTLLGPGEALPFRSRLASPPPETHDVLVRFFNRRDLGGAE
jgi:predicted Zn finger-like uncharacterized protein